LDVTLCPLAAVSALVIDSIKNNCSSGSCEMFFYSTTTKYLCAPMI